MTKSGMVTIWFGSGHKILVDWLGLVFPNKARGFSLGLV
jgi:hypothetical protein